ncbi:MAG: OmpA family protein [Pyrinomonadaceae bacterium]|nr:OmpA family protein [Pyrinomonadaceae bacterium]
MALFDSIVSGAAEKFGLGDKAGTLLSGLLALMTNAETDGISGFIGRFKESGLGDIASSWITSGDNADISGEQIQSVLGSETVDSLAEQAGIPADKTSEALGYMLPQVVDKLSPDGETPDDEGVLSKIGELLTGRGDAAAAAAAGAAGLAGAVASGGSDETDDAADAIGGLASDVSDKEGGVIAGGAGAAGNVISSSIDDDAEDTAGGIRDTASDAVEKGKEVISDAKESAGDAAVAAADKVGDAADAVKDAAGGVGDKASDAAEAVSDAAGAAVDKGKEVAGDAAEAVSDAAGAAVDKGKEVAGDAADAVAGAAGAAADKVGDAFDSVGDTFDGDGDGSILKWLLPLLLLGLLILLAFWFCGGNKDAKSTTNSNANADANANSGTGTGEENESSKNAEGNDAERKLTEVALPDGTKIQAYPGGIEDQMVKFLQSDEYKNASAEDLKDKWFDFDDLNFKLGKSELSPESKRQADNIVAILKAFPEAKIKIGGYTDKTGNDAANKKLSDNRAKAVQAALSKAGVGDQVPEAEGYGEEFAKVDETASDEERASDRKTSVRLIK